MRFSAPPRATDVRCDEMEGKLRDFIRRHVVITQNSTQPGTFHPYLLVARSAGSPVARALVSIGAEIAAAGVSVRAIFATLKTEPIDEVWSVAGPATAFGRDVRLAKNPRLADAHEQLVLGPATCWFGDCMRRLPPKRDAFESFVDQCEATTRLARISFERLWLASEPLLIAAPRPASAFPNEPHHDDAIQPEVVPPAQPEGKRRPAASTRT
jgi:hypothetical protein